MNGYEKQVKELLLKHGYKLIHTGKASHEIWTSDNGDSVIVNHICKSRHTANAIMKAASIKHRF